jgi:mannan endo-1,4-beta-mannosidase
MSPITCASLIAAAAALFSCGDNTSTEEKTAAAESFTQQLEMVDPDATYQTKSLLYNMKKLSKTGVMFGHDDNLVYGIGWKYADKPGNSDIKAVCGDYPAVFNWDLGHIEVDSTSNLDSVDFSLYRQQMKRAYQMGGINSISWHLRNPLTGGSTWDLSNDTVVRSILPGAELYPLFSLWLTKLGNYIKTIVDDNGTPIPLIFRPYHEHNGNWFWYAGDHATAQEYITLWKMTVSHLRDTMGIRNLIYAYSPDKFYSRHEYLGKYPGDEWVDILGCDVYDQPEYDLDYMTILPNALAMLKEIADEKGKLYALTETGRKNVADSTWWTERMFKNVRSSGASFVMTWRNHPSEFWAVYPGHKSEANFIEFYNDTLSIFLSDLPDMYSAD